MSAIMIVDDNEADQFLTQAIIEKFDPSIEVLQAYDGEEALQILEDMKTPPSVIILDINMPRMNGFEFLEVYCKKEKQARVITMLTSSAQHQDKEKAKAYRCVHNYLVKPLKMEDLVNLKNSL